MKKSGTSLDLEHRTAYRFAIMSALSTRCVADLYRKAGLTVGGWRTLSLIGRYEPIYPSGIAERSSVDPDKVTRAVDRLVDSGFVARKVDQEDRRRVLLTLTARGRRVYVELDHVRRVLESEFLSVLAPQELKQFHATMDKLEAHARRIFNGKGAWRTLLQEAPVRSSVRKIAKNGK